MSISIDFCQFPIASQILLYDETWPVVNKPGSPSSVRP